MRMSSTNTLSVKRFRILITIKKFERIEMHDELYGIGEFEHCLN